MKHTALVDWWLGGSDCFRFITLSLCAAKNVEYIDGVIRIPNKRHSNEWRNRIKKNHPWWAKRNYFSIKIFRSESISARCANVNVTRVPITKRSHNNTNAKRNPSRIHQNKSNIQSSGILGTSRTHRRIPEVVVKEMRICDLPQNMENCNWILKYIGNKVSVSCHATYDWNVATHYFVAQRSACME